MKRETRLAIKLPSKSYTILWPNHKIKAYSIEIRMGVVLFSKNYLKEITNAFQPATSAFWLVLLIFFKENSSIFDYINDLSCSVVCNIKISKKLINVRSRFGESQFFGFNGHFSNPLLKLQKKCCNSWKLAPKKYGHINYKHSNKIVRRIAGSISEHAILNSI